MKYKHLIILNVLVFLFGTSSFLGYRHWKYENEFIHAFSVRSASTSTPEIQNLMNQLNQNGLKVSFFTKTGTAPVSVERKNLEKAHRLIKEHLQVNNLTHYLGNVIFIPSKG